jgi:hypothetical protein
MSSPYQSPTRRLAADARLDNGSRVSGDIYLHPNTLAPGGYESPLAMLNGEEPFFPVAVEGAGVVLVGKRRTVSVSFSSSTDATEAGGAPNDPERVLTLELLLSDGRTLGGQAVAEMPSAYPRALDLVNGSDDFMPIRDETHVHLVNRAHIRTVHPID